MKKRPISPWTSLISTKKQSPTLAKKTKSTRTTATIYAPQIDSNARRFASSRAKQCRRARRGKGTRRNCPSDASRSPQRATKHAALARPLPRSPFPAGVARARLPPGAASAPPRAFLTLRAARHQVRSCHFDISNRPNYPGRFGTHLHVSMLADALNAREPRPRRRSRIFARA